MQRGDLATAPDVDAAAERLIELSRLPLEQQKAHVREWPELGWDGIAVARAWLAARADDGEDVTEEWLVDYAGFDPDDFGPMLPLPRDTRPLIPLDQGVVHIQVRGLDIAEAVFVNDDGDCSWFSVPVPTRGDVRTFCRLLGIDLKEPNHAT